MSIAPNRFKDFRNSVRTQTPDYQQPLGFSSGQLSPYHDYHLTFAVNDKNRARVDAEQATYHDEDFKAELLKQWAGADYKPLEVQPIIPASPDSATMAARAALDSHFANMPYDDLDGIVLYQSRARDKRIFWSKLNGSMPRGDSHRPYAHNLPNRTAPIEASSLNGHGNGGNNKGRAQMHSQQFVYRRQQNSSNYNRQPTVNLKPQAAV